MDDGLLNTEGTVVWVVILYFLHHVMIWSLHSLKINISEVINKILSTKQFYLLSWSTLFQRLVIEFLEKNSTFQLVCIFESIAC